MTTGEIAAMQRAIGEVRRCVAELRNRHGDTGPVLRMLNDVDRLSIDAADLCTVPEARHRHSGPVIAEARKVEVSDAPYDPDLWRGADDEGVGGQLRQRR
ncbi:hypothetical protein [Actinoalloteichus hymeniacidonis]|uniref:Uncharacterized protein n=1 Tax=Actinoalloteichus hymeniacidonis TaxID=340345 RepID=A0AAC9HNJ8_9PSEU|nr:hypothetical protein [Actinoalloteichus hymeniacidonis]AOS62516.1 hypothetical protein TL08_08505 [Actinoalloteichus hymeniacidonis]MBB5909453.1 hypothetical protein [Actinoalloteichus hymeniacidonis]